MLTLKRPSGRFCYTTNIMDSVSKAKYIIENNDNMTISSADASGKPWVSPVGFAYDDNYNLYWVSYKDSLHSNNIASRAEIAIVIFGQMPEGNIDGVYIDATAIELRDENEIEKGIRIFRVQRQQPSKFETRSIEDVTVDAAWRMYKATPVEISKRLDDTINGQAVTIREAIQL